MLRIYRDPEGGEGGTATAQSFDSLRSKSPGELRSSLMQSLSKKSEESQPSNASQPASGGNQQSGALAGQKVEGDNQAPINADQSTTAQDVKETSIEGKGTQNEWSAEERQLLESKSWGETPYNEHTAKVLKSFQEAETRLNQLSQSNTSVLSKSDQIEAALKAGDLGALKRFGIETPLIHNSFEDQIKTEEKQFDDFVGTINPYLQQLRAAGKEEYANGVEEVAQFLQEQSRLKVNGLQEQLKTQKLEASILAKAGHADPYKAKADNSEKVLTELSLKNPGAIENSKQIAELTKVGGPLYSIGIGLNNAYENKAAAEFFDNAIENQKTVNNIPKMIEDAIKEHEAKKTQLPASTVTGNAGAVQQQSVPSLTSSLAAYRKSRGG